MLQPGYSYIFCFQIDLNWWFFIWTSPDIHLVEGFINMFGFDLTRFVLLQYKEYSFGWQNHLLCSEFWWHLLAPAISWNHRILWAERCDQGSVAGSFKAWSLAPSFRKTPRAKGCDARAKGDLQSVNRKQNFLKEGLNEAVLKGARGGGGVNTAEIKLLGELQNTEVTVTFGGVAEWCSSPFVSCSHLICAFVSCSSSSRCNLQYFDDNASFLADYCCSAPPTSEQEVSI